MKESVMEDVLPSAWVFTIFILWIAALIGGTVVVAINFKRERGRAQRLALWGFSLMLAVSVIRTAIFPLLSWWFEPREVGQGSISAAVGGFLWLIQVAAIICIVYAFWLLGRARVSAQ
jgi:hypothetical protein